MSGEHDKKAFLTAIPVASVLAAGSFVVFGTLGRDRFVSQIDWLEIAKVFLAYAVFMLPFVAFGGVLIGLPTAMLLRRYGVRALAIWLFAGSIAGGAVSFAILGCLAVRLTADVAIWATVIGVLPGFAAAMLWWKIAEQPRLRFDEHA